MQIARDDLLKAYRLMRSIRVFEDRVHEEFATGRIPGFVHLYAGEEASAVGVCMHLTDRDYIGSTHRGHGHCIAKGCDIGGMMLELYGKRDGLCKGKGGSMHIADFDKGMMGANSIVGAGVPLAVGAALAAKTLGTGAVAVPFCGDGGANQGGVLETSISPPSGSFPWSSCSRTTVMPRPRPRAGRSPVAISSTGRPPSACPA
jgi:pyruvate dehydrogenase E1 component alpha subunit